MKVAVTGSSGFIGSALLDELREHGHDVLRVVRRSAAEADEISWDPLARRIDPHALDGVDAVVHLAGVGVGERRWTPRRQRAIMDSRVAGTDTISRAIASANPRPQVLLSASAVGWYRDTGDVETDEHGQHGHDFLAQVCAAWELNTRPAAEAGTRVAWLRTGLVLGPGGVLARIKPLFSLGLGGRLGSGRQYWPWISLTDHVAAIRFLLEHEVSGAVNLTGPAPVTNAEFTRALGAILSRPAVFAVPAWSLRLVLGEFADQGVLVSQRIVPRALEDAGFAFRHRTVEDALRWALGR
jgi:uncharacterized protein (TIGR01777 family)